MLQLRHDYNINNCVPHKENVISNCGYPVHWVSLIRVSLDANKLSFKFKFKFQLYYLLILLLQW